MKKFMMILVMLCLTAQTAFSQATAPEDDSMGLSIYLENYSTYLWRGTYYMSGSAFFPGVAYDAMKTEDETSESALVLNLLGEISGAWVLDGKDASGGSEDFNALDLGVEYSYTMKEKVSFGAELWYYTMQENANSFGSAVVFVTLESFLKPTLKYTHDYYTDTKDKKDFYVQMLIGHEIESEKKEAKLEFELSAGYYQQKSLGLDRAGISDITAVVKPTANFGDASLYAAFNLIYVPSKDFYMMGTVEDKLRYFTVFGASYSL